MVVVAGVGPNAADWPGRQFVKGHLHTHSMGVSRDVGSETKERPRVSMTWVLQRWKMSQKWMDGSCSCGFYKAIGKNRYPPAQHAVLVHLFVVYSESKDWRACLHNSSSSSVIRTWCTLTLLMTLHMVDIVQDGYFLQKLSLFFQLHRLFFSTFGIEPPPSIDFSGQWCRPESEKLFFFNHFNLLYSII